MKEFVENYQNNIGEIGESLVADTTVSILNEAIAAFLPL